MCIPLHDHGTIITDVANNTGWSLAERGHSSNVGMCIVHVVLFRYFGNYNFGVILRPLPTPPKFLPNCGLNRLVYPCMGWDLLSWAVGCLFVEVYKSSTSMFKLFKINHVIVAYI